MLIAIKLDAILEKSLMILTTIVLLMIMNVIIFISIKMLN